MTFEKLLLAFFILIVISCKGEKEPINNHSKISKEEIYSTSDRDTANMDTAKIALSNTIENSRLEEIINDMELRKVPFIDSTNFDNFKKNNFLSKHDISVMQLEKIYPEFYINGYNYKSIPSYSISFSEKFHSVVLTTYKGEHEIESTLINYDLNGNLIDFLLISYDEIAEGWSRIESKIEKNKVTVTSTLWLEDKQVEVKIFEIDPEGKIKSVID